VFLILEIDPPTQTFYTPVCGASSASPGRIAAVVERGGVFNRSTAGETWNKLTNGLRSCSAESVCGRRPAIRNVVYAIVESKDGTLYRSDDRGETFKQVSKQANIVRADSITRACELTPITRTTSMQSPQACLNRSMVQVVSLDNREDPHRLSRVLGWTRKKPQTHLGRRGWRHCCFRMTAVRTGKPVYNIPLGQFYQIHADNRLPFYYVMGGLQDNGTWTGPSRTREPAGIMNDDWRMVSFGDGFYILNHLDDPELYISEIPRAETFCAQTFRTRSSRK